MYVHAVPKKEAHEFWAATGERGDREPIIDSQLKLNKGTNFSG